MIDFIRDDNIADEVDRPGDEYVKGQIRKICGNPDYKQKGR